eukprot:8555220-Lingulodinium_polyedra.AAC.1
MPLQQAAPTVTAWTSYGSPLLQNSLASRGCVARASAVAVMSACLLKSACSCKGHRLRVPDP